MNKNKLHFISQRNLNLQTNWTIRTARVNKVLSRLNTDDELDDEKKGVELVRTHQLLKFSNKEIAKRKQNWEQS